MKKAKNVEDVIALARELLQKGAYAISEHAKLRQEERYCTIGDIKNIINTGYHEKRKTNIKRNGQIGTTRLKGKL